MAYLVVDDFRLGMDRRKSRVSGKPGQLWVGKNGHITRGGEFERRKKFVAKYELPANTHGLAGLSSQIYVFGSVSSPVGLPAGVSYQRLQHSDGSTAMSGVISQTTFGGKLYEVAEFSGGARFHYYDGTRVASWDAIAAAVGSNNAVATALAAKIDAVAAYMASAVGAVVTITAAVAGTPYTIGSSTINGGVNGDQTLTLAQTQANIAPVSEVRSTGTITVTGGTNNPGTNKLSSVTIDGVEVLNTAVDWATSNSATATAIAAQINSYNSSPEYTAAAVGNLVTITAAAGTGAGPNGFVIIPTVAGDVTVETSGTMANGVTAVSAQAQVYTATVGGTFEAADTFTITLDGVDYSVSGAASGTGITALTYQQKIYSVINSLLYFSALNTPTLWGSGTGNGFINMSNQNEGNESLTAVQEYQTRMAIFSRSNIRIWNIDVDPANNAFQQTVQNTGTVAARSVLPYGNIDVFYLDDSGVRSLRARDSSNSPSVNDVGVAIDTFITEYLATLSETQVQRACAIIEPVDGRYWLAVGQRIFVFSYFPGSKINAWTYYDLSDEIGEDDISDMIRVGKRIYLRAGDTIFLYGGDDNATYPDDDEIEAEIQFPFLAAGSPATFKGITGFDIGLSGVWHCYLLPDPANESVELDIGTFSKNTFSQPKNAIEMPTCMFALRFNCSRAGAAKVSNCAVHYNQIEAG